MRVCRFAFYDSHVVERGGVSCAHALSFMWWEREITKLARGKSRRSNGLSEVRLATGQLKEVLA